MAKGLGLLLVFSCGALLGWGKARALEQRAGELACWQEFLRQFRTVLESTRAGENGGRRRAFSSPWGTASG